jgi:hypothetical protein
MDHFLAGCRFNTSIDWIIVTDIEQIEDVAENIHFIKSDLDSINKLAYLKLGFPVKIRTPYKICDFKPLYGLIFEDWLKKYDYWGYCDIDLILGRIEQFLSPDKLWEYDIISTYKGFLSGPFCLYRNTEKLKKLFTYYPDYKSLLQNPNYLGFDENIQRKSIVGFSLRKIWYLFQFIVSSIFNANSNPFTIREFRYQFQWYVKRKTVNELYPSDFTEIVFSKYKKGKNKLYTEELVLSDSYYKRMNRKTWRLQWNNGILSDLDNTRQIFGFHFRESKNLPGFKVDNFTGEFFITEKGIFNNKA